MGKSVLGNNRTMVPPPAKGPPSIFELPTLKNGGGVSLVRAEVQLLPRVGLVAANEATEKCASHTWCKPKVVPIKG